MTIQKNDPCLTAYVLGELEENDRAEIENALDSSPALRAEVQEIRATAGLMEEVFSSGDGMILTREQISRVETAADTTVFAGRRGAGFWLKIAAGLLLMIGLPFVVVRNMESTGDSEIGVVSRIETAHLAVSDRSPEPGEELDQTTAGAVLETGPEGQIEAGKPRRSSPISSTSASPPASAGEKKEEPARPSQPVEQEQSEDLRPAGIFRASSTSEVAMVTAPTAPPPASAEIDAIRGGQAGAPQPKPAAGGVVQERRIANLPVALGREALALFEMTAGKNRAIGSSFVSRYDFPPDRIPPPHNTEGYDRIVGNDFKRVLDSPLSTFSIDVDTASYANVRRFLTQGSLPPPDAVRLEEMINYFSYEYPQPTGSHPFSVNLESASAPWRQENRLLRIGLKGRELEGARPASNLVFLLDVSGSMSPANKLPLLRRAMRLLVDRLRPQDRVAIAVYAGASGLVLRSTPGNQKAEIIQALDHLQAGGSTNGAAGIELAYSVAESNRIEGGVNRVILATDGDFNVGVTDRGSLTRMIGEKAKKGIFLSVLGFGMGNLKDSTLEQLADKGNGNYGYIDTIREARKLLVEQMDGTLVTIAKDVKIQVEFNPARVAAYRLIGYENRALANEDFNNDAKDAGEIGAGHRVTALYEVVPVGGAIPTPGVDPLKYQQPPAAPSTVVPSDELLTVKLRYKQPEGETSQLLEVPYTDSGSGWATASRDFKFAAAVAGFGMILRQSPHRGNATLSSVLELARESGTIDAHGYRTEFLQLVETAQRLSGN